MKDLPFTASCFSSGHEASDSFTHIIVNGDCDPNEHYYSSYKEVLTPFTNSFLDRATQTSFRYIPKKLQKSLRRSSKTDSVAHYTEHQDEPYSGIYTIPISPREVSPIKMKKSVPLARSASYEKAILSSLKDYTEGDTLPRDAPRRNSKKIKATTSLGSSAEDGEACRRKKNLSPKKRKTRLSVEENNELQLLKYQELDVTLSEDESKRIRPSSSDSFLKQLEEQDSSSTKRTNETSVEF